MKKIKRLRLVKRLLLFFIVSLFISGLTAIPVDWELSYLLNYFSPETTMHYWLSKVLGAYNATKEKTPFLLYGYDWLAFAHFVLAILFVGAYRNPLRNIWVIEFGLIACVLIFPFALVAGHYRGIPVGWRFIDCSFGLIGFVVLWTCYRHLKYIFYYSKPTHKLHESV